MRPDPRPTSPADVTRDTTELLRALIRFRTVNPPGEELAIASHIAGVLREAGIESRVIETAPGRAAVTGRIRGAGAVLPVLLLAHMDVVGADASEWSVDPFAGEVRDGYVYGRGAIDDKGMLAVNLMTMLLLQRDVHAGAISLRRDVVFLATPDEETGGTLGIEWLIEHEPEALRAEYAINEGGRVRVAPDGSRTLLLQVAEKSSHIVTLTARGVSGHAGVPRADNCILRLGRALAAISTFASDPANGVSPTVLRAGAKDNVIPAEASVTLNVRTRPDQLLDDIVSELERLVNDPDVDIAIVERGQTAPASADDSPMFHAIADSARALDPAITVKPYLSAGVTDSARLRMLGVQAYGVLPFPLTPDDEGRMHGADERVPIAALGFATQLVLGAVTRIARVEPLN